MSSVAAAEPVWERAGASNQLGRAFPPLSYTADDAAGLRLLEPAPKVHALNGVDLAALSQQTMAARAGPGLYFIGEVVDVTGWLGGYNFQWAWASAHACAQALGERLQTQAG